MKGSTDFRSFTPEAQEVIRIRAVETVRAGMMKFKAAEVLASAVVLFRVGCEPIFKVAKKP